MKPRLSKAAVQLREQFDDSFPDRDGNDKSVLEITATDVGLVPKLQYKSKAKESAPSW